MLSSFLTAFVSVSSTVVSEMATAVMGLSLPFVVTEKAEGSAVVAERVSL